MKFSSFSFAERGVLGFLSHLAEGLMPLQGQASTPGADGKGNVPRESSVPASEPTKPAPGVPGPAAQWWQDHPAPGTPVFWVDDQPGNR